MRETEVLIVGGGPVGAIGAVHLASMEIDVLCCEQTESFASDHRASTIHAATLEMLDAAEPLIAKGLKAPVLQWRDRASDRGDPARHRARQLHRRSRGMARVAGRARGRRILVPGDKAVSDEDLLRDEAIASNLRCSTSGGPGSPGPSSRPSRSRTRASWSTLRERPTPPAWHVWPGSPTIRSGAANTF
ncbi:FAD-dependent monooxygenase [Novosphingobium sp. BW1]|uniref:FAD-dependent monooxygenase n=1 Tax=Novosphingobium sp. BW1 TaxID=2592621 RepID=UPI001396B471